MTAHRLNSLRRTALAFSLALCLAFGLALLPACSGGGQKAPAGLETVDAAGFQKILDANKGKVTLVMLWATWCPACKTELPVLEQLRAKYPAEKLDIRAISVDDGAEAMTAFLASRPLSVTVQLSAPDVAAEFGVSSIPQLVIFDREGKVAFNNAGAYPFEMLDTVIGSLVKG